MGVVNYFKAFFLCGATAAAILIMAGREVTGAAEYWVVVLSIVPLGVYHLYYLAFRHRNELDQSAVDSVYYLGFLITLGCVGTVALRLTAQVEVATLLPQFALGLLATGYAVLARVHLQTLAPDTSDGDAAIAVDRAATSWREMSAAAQVALSTMTDLQNQTQDANRRTIETARDELMRTMREALREFRAAFADATTEAQRQLNDLRASALSADVIREKQALADLLRSSTGTIGAFDASLIGLIARLDRSKDALDQVATAGLAVHGAVDAQVASSASLAEAVERVERTTGALTAGLGALTEAVRKEAAALSVVEVAGTTTLIRQLEERERKVQEALTALGDSITSSARDLASAAGSASTAARTFTDGLVTAAKNVVDATRRI